MYSMLRLLALAGAASASVLSRNAVRARASNANVTLAVKPQCGPLTGSSPADANAGLVLDDFKTIVVFGDGYSSGGNSGDGATLPPAVMKGSSPMAGGRLANGELWVEYLANDLGAHLIDYAVNGSVTEEGLWPGVPNTQTLDNQVNILAGQPDQQDPSSTLYVIFLGINDYDIALATNLTTRLINAAEDIAYDMLELISEPAFAKNILVVDNYGRGTTSAVGQTYKEGLFTALNTIHTRYSINVGFVDFSTLWEGVLGSTPGYKAFGYTNPGACAVSSNTIVGACDEPATSFYWIPGFPSTSTHRIMADFVEDVLTQCT